MSLADRLPDAVWPAEKNVGGLHRTARHVLGPLLLALGLVALAGLHPGTTGLAGPLVGVGYLVAGIVTLVEAHTQKCPGYAAMGINTCELREPTTTGTEEAT